jgi:hypothetical protein
LRLRLGFAAPLPRGPGLLGFLGAAGLLALGLLAVATLLEPATLLAATGRGVAACGLVAAD